MLCLLILIITPVIKPISNGKCLFIDYKNMLITNLRNEYSEKHSQRKHTSGKVKKLCDAFVNRLTDLLNI